MRFSLATSLFFAASAHGAFLSASNSTTTITITSSTTATTSSSYSSTPTPTSYSMQCAGSMGGLCGDVCFCSSGQMNCHADPSARCYQMCKCVAESLKIRNMGFRRG
ncbi:hypothetical protein F4801DRAFT_71357 [Xylaria longipes]|nr:hypothetical protein F4801DRAFT_71357 [Xylaria longipes]